MNRFPIHINNIKYLNHIFLFILFIKLKWDQLYYILLKIRIVAELRECWRGGGWVYKASWSWIILSLFLECGSIYVGVSCRNIVFVTTHWTPSLWLCAFVPCFTTHWKHNIIPQPPTPPKYLQFLSPFTCDIDSAF